MNNSSASLAQSITYAGSKQSYYTARLLVDKDLVEDCYRAYAYFRWADDVVDDPACTRAQRISFIQRQRDIINHLYEGQVPDDLSPEERIIADLVGHDLESRKGLQSFINNFLAAIAFDADRRGRPISEAELDRYSRSLGVAVTDAIQYFIGNGHQYPNSNEQYLAATAAHITHMLRDMRTDIQEGFINIPIEYLEGNKIMPSDVDSEPYQTWIQGRVELAREYFRRGKQYLEKLQVLRCKIAGYWYCSRFEKILDTVERDGYQLRWEYKNGSRIGSFIRLVWLTIVVTFRHFTS